MKLIIYGINGRMGQVLNTEVLKDESINLVGGISRKKTNIGDGLIKPEFDDFEVPDVIIDFSHFSNLGVILNYSVFNNVALVLATTGYSSDDYQLIKEASMKIPIIYSSNYSVGFQAIKKSLREYIKNLENFDIDIIEKHNKNKLDKPSGTALKFIEEIKSFKEVNIPIHSLRSGNIVGEHSIIFSGEDETIEVIHKITSRRVFAIAALKAAKFIYKKEKGLYTMDDLLGSELNGNTKYN